ncbi:MAG: S8 family serine peptidase, partial [Gammaproteobacteria bacterium]|nr:S8 family serine peptidase [Gammaproteobacteria bacterium]
MRYRLKTSYGLICAAFLAVAIAQSPVLAKSVASAAKKGDTQRYIVVLDDMPLVAYDGRLISTPERAQNTIQLAATSISFTGEIKVDVKSTASRKYTQFLDERFNAFRGEALLRLGRQLKTVHRYRNVLNGFATDLNPSEVKALREMRGVRAVVQDELHHIDTDAGPAWIGADKIHDGSAGVSATGGEGTVIGVVDGGINWDHLSFQDPGESGGGYNHVNPYGAQLGLCSDSEVLCNDKLVGVYDFIVDDPDTEVEEENTKGKDNDGHGSHVASTAAGNPLDITFNGVSARISGVAPNANIVTYRVCFIGDPADPDDDACPGSAILAAVEQAVTDAVDVINMSLGGPADDPWNPGSYTFALLNARAAGIFVATSSGNGGPNGGSIGTPANAPWNAAVGYATHDRVSASVLENLSGGDTAAPDDLFGASFTDGIGIRKIVHAKDFGNALCGIGESESFTDCGSFSGSSNPFDPGTFSGEIVVCDRGDYGRVEKGSNVKLAGAGGYILANTAAQGETVVPDSHCLPATHLGVSQGDELRVWLDSGSNHQGSLSGFSFFKIPEAGDTLAFGSSRGPNLPPVENVMKPDVIAPGINIIAAWSEGDDSYGIISGSSMSSPHVAGGAALLKSVHPDWNPAAISSALIMTATPDQAIDFDGSNPTVHEQGGGRVRLDQAVNAGLYLNETKAGFLGADPFIGGNPKNLNLPGLVDTHCVFNCSFQRWVTDLAGGAIWTATAEGLPSGASVSISPTRFSLGSGANRPLTINVDLSDPDTLGSWVYGKVRLTSPGLADAVFPLAVFSASGSLPFQWDISTDEISGWKDFALNDLVAIPDATYTSGGLTIPTTTVENLPQDPTPNDPYDDLSVAMVVWHEVSAEALMLYTETLDSTAVDLDLYVGMDSNGNGIPEASEQLCSSTTPQSIELCVLLAPVSGDYWVLVHNWEATLDPDEATLISVVAGKDTPSPLSATGDGIIPARANFNVRLAWDNVNAVPGTKLFGAVGIGTDRDNPNNLGIIPVNFTKTAVAEPETLVLMNGISRGLTLNASATHDRSFIDIPPGVDTLSISANGADSTQSENLTIELYRQDFDDAFANAPFVVAPDTSGSPLASATGTSSAGPVVSVSGSTLLPGRWFAVVKNNRGQHAAVEIKADLT